MVFVWVGLGSALGGMSRYAVSVMMARMAGIGFPYGTLAVNVVGSFAIGWALGAIGDRFHPSLRQFLIPGFCGGFTTFSAFSLETLLLARDGQPGKALANVLVSVALCLAAVWAGYSARAQQ